MNVNLYNTTDYENKSNWTLGENKPNSKPIKANLHFTAENTEDAEKKDISVSDCSIDKYALYAISPCSLRTRRLMKNNAKTNPIQSQSKPISVKKCQKCKTWTSIEQGISKSEVENSVPCVRRDKLIPAQARN